MRNHTIALHLSEPQTTVTTTTLDRLTREDLYRPTGTRVDLVVHHMLETLIVSWAEVDLRLQLASGVAMVHNLQTSRLVTLLAKELRDGLDSEVRERRRIALVSDECRELGK